MFPCIPGGYCHSAYYEKNTEQNLRAQTTSCAGALDFPILQTGSLHCVHLLHVTNSKEHQLAQGERTQSHELTCACGGPGRDESTVGPLAPLLAK